MSCPKQLEGVYASCRGVYASYRGGSMHHIRHAEALFTWDPSRIRKVPLDKKEDQEGN